MERKVISGRYKPELEQKLLDEILSRQKNDRFAPDLIVCGSRILAVYLSKTIADQTGAVLNVRTLTLFEIAERLVPLERSDIPLMPLPLRQCIIRQILLENPSLSYFKEVKEKPGFVKILSAAFEDINESCVTRLPSPHELENLKEKGFSINLEKISEVYSLYEKYRERISGKFFELCDIFALAAENAGNLKSVFGVDRVIFYGIYDMNEAQKRFLLSVSEKNPVILMLPYEKKPAYAYADSFVSWLENHGFTFEHLSRENCDRGNTLLGRLQNALNDPELITDQSSVTPRSNGFSEDEEKSQETMRIKEGSIGSEKETESASADGSFAIIGAPGEPHEVKEIAREVLKLTGERKIPFCEMAVILRTPSIYRRLLTEEFRRLSIPYYFTDDVYLSETRDGRSFLLLCDLIDSNYPRKQVMDFLRFARLDRSKIPGAPSQHSYPEYWNKISAEANIIEGRDQWEKRLEAQIQGISIDKQSEPDTDPESPPKLAERGKNNNGESGDLGESQSKITPREKREEAAKALLACVRYIFDSLESIPDEGNASQIAGPLLELYRNIVRDSLERSLVLKETSSLIKAAEMLGPLKKEAVLNLIKDHLSSVYLPKGKPGQGIWIIDIMSARCCSFPVIFLPGLVEKAFPALPTEDPIILDSERKALSSFGTGVFPLKKEQGIEERLLFELTALAASDHLIISYPRFDAYNARTRLPSIYALDAASIAMRTRLNYENFEKSPFVKRAPFIPGYSEESGFATSLPELHLSLLFPKGGEISKTGEMILKNTEEVSRSLSMLEKRYKTWSFTEYDGVIKSVNIEKSLEEHVFTATELETYTSCPYKYFHEFILCARPFAEPERVHEISPEAKGTLVHGILWEFFATCQEKSLLPLDEKYHDEYVKILKQVSSKHFEILEQSGECGLYISWNRNKNNIMGSLITLLLESYKDSAIYTPYRFEQPFGRSNNSEPPLIIHLENDTFMKCSGKIDRIDIGQDGSLRVIDYKTGKINLNKDDPFKSSNPAKYPGYKIQTMIYILAAECLVSHIGKPPGSSPLGELFFLLSKPGTIERVSYGGNEYENHKDRLIKILVDVDKFMKNSLFFYYPSDLCESCEHQAACPAERKILFVRKSRGKGASSIARSLVEFLQEE